jgi:outer membrane protein OmpA-like peptidoglycan-associated protein
LNKAFLLVSDIKFEYDQAAISKESFGNLDYIADMLKNVKEYNLTISAHTCDVGGAEYNMKLSKNRAKSVIEYFVSKGIPRNKLIAQGHGQSQPLVTNDTEEGRAANRRVEFVIKIKEKK